jgi:hypothetical protein
VYDLSGQEVVIMEIAVSGYARSCRYGHLKEKIAENIVFRKRHLQHSCACL